MKVYGRVIGKALKEVKGEDDEVLDVGVVTVRLDAKGGKLVYQPGDEAFAEIDLGDKATIAIDFSQQKLDLNRRAKEQREAAGV